MTTRSLRRAGMLAWDRATDAKLVDSLVVHVAVSHVSEPGSLERYVINSTGRRIAETPSIADSVLKALASGQSGVRRFPLEPPRPLPSCDGPFAS